MEEFKDKLTPYVALWPAYSFYVILLGYLGFYSYSALNNIPFALVEISTIVGIGLYNLLVISLIYVASNKNKEPRMYEALIIFGLLNWLSANPILICTLIVLVVQIFIIRTERKSNNILGKKTGTYSEKKKKVLRRPLRNIRIDIVTLVCVTLFSLFFNGNIVYAYFFIYFISRLFHYLIRKKKVSFITIAIISLIFPILTSNYLFNDIKYTIFGLSKEYAKIHLLNNSIHEGTIVYKNSTEVYIRNDSVKQMIPISTISRIETIKNKLKPKTGIEEYKDLFESFNSN